MSEFLPLEHKAFDKYVVSSTLKTEQSAVIPDPPLLLAVQTFNALKSKGVEKCT